MKDLRRLLPLFGEYRRDLFLAMGFVLPLLSLLLLRPLHLDDCVWRTI